MLVSRTSALSFLYFVSSNQLEITLSYQPNNVNSCPSDTMTKLRTIRKILPRTKSHWVGDGFLVHPVFADAAFTEEVSPLLMFDYAAPKSFPPQAKGTPPLGVGKHPHKGFETVTVAFQGEVEHQDSTGEKDVISSGDVQWMTAGSGIVHQEFHSNAFTEKGGTFEMCQLWVNLPRKDKLTKPHYQPILKQNIPAIPIPSSMVVHEGESRAASDADAGTVRLIAGEFNSVKGAAETYSPVNMWDISFPTAKTVIDLPYPADHNCIVFVRRGSVEVLSGDSDQKELKTSTLGPQDVAMMHYDDSSTLRLRVKENDSSVMILGGLPLNEPIAAHGPFVMNTNNEINEAISEYRMGKFGQWKDRS